MPTHETRYFLSVYFSAVSVELWYHWYLQKETGYNKTKVMLMKTNWVYTDVELACREYNLIKEA
jgi:hypothetical protein